MKKRFRKLLAAASCLALTGFMAACSGGSKSADNSAAETQQAAEEVQQTPFEAAAEIVKDLPKDDDAMTQAQRMEFLDKAKPLCEETNGKPAEIVADCCVLCLDNENKVVFNNMLSSSTDTNHQLVSGWVAPDNASKWGSVKRFVLVSSEVGDPLKTGDVYNP